MTHFRPKPIKITMHRYKVTFEPCVDGVCQNKPHSMIVKMGAISERSNSKATVADVLKGRFKRYNKYKEDKLDVNKLTQDYYVQIRNLYAQYPGANKIEVGRVIDVEKITKEGKTIWI